MVDSSRIDIREIIKKTGHSLEEIRLRALENILSKLRNGIIFTEDLIHHKELIVNLLEWFNHENPSKIKEVLELLHSLAKHGAAVSLLQSLGGVEFFSRLRRDLSEDGHLALVDSILDSIFWLHEEEEQIHVNTNSTSIGTISLARNKHSQIPLDEKGTVFDYEDDFNGSVPSRGKESHHHSNSHLPSIERPISHHEKKPNIDASFENLHLKYMKSKGVKETNAWDLRDIAAEWIVLTSSDRHILSVTESRLQSHSMELVWQSCEFFRDVLLQDFPTHIFIQRPNIVKILLSLLDIYPQKEDGIVPMLVRCLNDVTAKLAKSLLHQASPDLSQSPKLKETFNSTTSSVNTELSSLHSRTTSFNGEGNSMHSGNTIGKEVQSHVESDPEDFEGAILTEALQQSQWTALDYCFHLVPNVTLFVKQAIEGGNHCDDAVILLNNVLNLLCLYDVHSFWTSEGDERKVYDVMSCLRNFSDLIQVCLDKKCAVISQPWNSVEVETVFPLLGSLTAMSIRFICLTVPYEKVFEAVPESLLSSYKVIFADEILAQIYPSIRVSLHGIMKAAEEEFYVQLQHVSSVVSSMQATMNFLHEALKETNMNKKVGKLLSLCNASLLSVGFHQSKIFITSALNMISNLFSRKDLSTDIASKGIDILLHLFSHKKNGVRLVAYSHCLEILTDALSESHVTNPISSTYRKALFLIDTSVLEEIIAFGIAGTDKETTGFAMNIVVTLLLGRLSMPSHVWQNLLYSIIPVLPLIQCFAEMDKALGRALVTISDPSNALLASDGENFTLPPLEQLRASFRFMFVKDDSIRARGFSSVVWTLSQEDNNSGSSIMYPHEVIQNASDLFLVSPTMSGKYQTGERGNFGFNGSSLDHLWDVFASSTVDESLRESSAEQLSVLVQDPTLHSQLLDHGADKTLLQSIRERTKQVNFYSPVSIDQNSKMLQPCITILRYLVQYNATLRHKLAVNRNLLLDILRCRIGCYQNEVIHFEASWLLVLLTFDEAFKTNGNELFLPVLIAKRYLLPLKFKTLEMTTTHRQKTFKDDTQKMKSLEEEPLHSMIRVSWNVISAAHNFGDAGMQINASESLPLSSTEIKLLKELVDNASVRRYLNTLLSSESMSAISTAMQDLSKHMTSCVCHLNTSAIVKDITEYIQNQKALDRLVAITPPKGRTVHLQKIIYLCQLIALVESRMIPLLAKAILTVLLEPNGPVSNAVSNYTMIRTQEADIHNGERGTYDLTNESRILFKNILHLVSSLCLKMNSTEESLHYVDVGGIGGFVSLLLQTFNKVDSTRYYDLPVLESTLDCLSHLTYRRGWSLQCSGSGEELCSMLANVFIQILYSFHVDRIGASTSFMGKGVIAKAAVGLCHVAMENQACCENKDWTVNWMSRNLQQGDEVIEDDLPWLLPLLTDRVLDIRWCGWSLSTALFDGIAGAKSVVNEFQVFPGGVWASAVGVILDNFENPLVRTQACRLISIALAKLKESGKQSVDRSLWESMIVQDTQTQENISGVPAFLLLLDHFNFFSNVKEQLVKKTVDSTSASSMTSYQNVSTSCSTPATDVEFGYESMNSDTNGALSTDDGSTVPISTRSGNERSSNPGGSSSECLLSSSPDSLNTEPPQTGQIYSRYPVRQQLKIAKRNESGKLQNPTPKLKAAIFQLISVLIEIDPENTIISLETESFLNVLMRSMDPDLITSHFSRSDFSCVEMKSFMENAEMTKNILRVINLITIHRKDACMKLDVDQHFSGNITSLFRIPNNFSWSSTSTNVMTLSLWNEALRILIRMCLAVPNSQKPNSEKEIFNNFDVLVVSFAYAASLKRASQTTTDLFLILFKALFCKEGRREFTERTLPSTLDSPCSSFAVFKQDPKLPSSSDANIGGHVALGGYMSTLLINMSSSFSVTTPGRRAVLSSLSALFVVSTLAKTSAIEHGFLESVIEDMKDIHVKLNLASLKLIKDENQNKTEKMLMKELACIFDLLRNLVHASSEAKDASAQSGLLTSIHRMWSWCMVEKALKLSLLEFLAAVMCNCTKAQEFVCHGGASSGRQSQDENSLFQGIIKLLVKLHKDAMAPTGIIEKSLRVAFLLLTNLATLSDCRSLIWKCNFLQHFKSSQVGQSANKKQKVASKVLTALWVQLILVLSFSADGAHAVLKVDGMLPTLIAFASEEGHRERQRSLLVLRNLLFFPANKPSLVTNGHLVTCLLKAIDSKSIWSKSIVVSCFASLLHNCHKRLLLHATGGGVIINQDCGKNESPFDSKSRLEEYKKKKAKVALKKTRLLGKLQLLNEEVFAGKIVAIDDDKKGYEELKMALKKTINSLTS